jgi:hypothetical protein
LRLSSFSLKGKLVPTTVDGFAIYTYKLKKTRVTLRGTTIKIFAAAVAALFLFFTAILGTTATLILLVQTTQ